MKKSSDAELRWVKLAFKKYYSMRANDIHVPSKIENREFAFALFGGTGMVRHIAFKSGEELKEYLIFNVPRHAFHSSAYYSYPAADTMEDKEWLGADLVFDIDVDHIVTPCKALHDTWLCPKCGATGKGFVQACPKCGDENLKRKTWVCETCINVARDEVIKLIDMLLSDFGFSDKEVYAVFSGHRGFHVHVEAESVLELGQDARREIADYVRGLGLNYKAFTTEGSRANLYRLTAKPEDPGWHGRVARSVMDWFLSLDDREVLKVTRGRRVSVLKKYSAIARSSEDADWIESLELTRREWENILSLIAKSEGVEIDERVTIDIKRLIRLPGSLHGKTGLKVVKLSIYDVENSDILKTARVFSDEEVRVRAKDLPAKVLDAEFKEQVDGVVHVPLYLAVYLVANGAQIELIDRFPVKLARV